MGEVGRAVREFRGKLEEGREGTYALGKAEKQRRKSKGLSSLPPFRAFRRYFSRLINGCDTKGSGCRTWSLSHRGCIFPFGPELTYRAAPAPAEYVRQGSF